MRGFDFAPTLHRRRPSKGSDEAIYDSIREVFRALLSFRRRGRRYMKITHMRRRVLHSRCFSCLVLFRESERFAVALHRRWPIKGSDEAIADSSKKVTSHHKSMHCLFLAFSCIFRVLFSLRRGGRRVQVGFQGFV